MKRFVPWLPLLLLITFITVVFFFHGPYGGTLSCVYKIMKKENSVNMAFLGTSRVVYGVDSDLISTMLARGDKEYVAINIAKNGNDWHQTYIMTRDLLNLKKIDVLVVEFNFHPYPRGLRLHYQDNGVPLANIFIDSMFDQGLSLGERFQVFFSRLPFSILRPVYYQLRLGATPRAENKTTACSAAFIGTGPIIPMADDYRPSEAINISQRDHYWLSRIIELTKSHGVELQFIYLPSLMENAEYRLKLETLSNKYGIKLVYPSDEMIERLQSSFFKDQLHLNTEGKTIYSSWLGSVLKDL